MKNAFNVLINRFEIAEEKYHELEDTSVQIPKMKYKEKRNEKQAKPRAFMNHNMVSKGIMCII